MTGTGAYEEFGRALAGAGDVDGDGVPDAAAGAPQTLAGGTGWVRALSGVDGATLWTVTGTGAYEEFGRALAGAGDVDGDGDPDLAVGSAQAGVGLRAGSVRVYDGTTGAHVLSLHGGVPGDQVGWSVAGVGDLDFDGRAEIATGLPYADSHGADAGRVLVFGDTSPDLLGPIPGLAGSINTLHVSEVPAGAKVVFLYGTTAGLAGSPLCAGVFAGMADPVVAGHAFADGNGYAFLNVSVPGGAAGRTFLVQAFVPSTCQVSNLVVAAF
ncbi:MAG: hypothetical protein D6702_11580 [Planctomycetota bacterium]|nr:MAG: hypothetical protein D6702_11580 [Planctomycetota bacterium]